MTDVPDALRQALTGRYDMESMIGRGGMATVYRARDVKHGRTVAVKVLRSDLGELIGPERFLREIEIAARLMHPNILPLYDSGRAPAAERGTRGEADILYYVMPFVTDESLRGLLSRVRLMDHAGAVEIVQRLASALDYAHAGGILHRDIKPENILLPGGQAVLADFGIAKAVSSATDAANLTRTGIALGTPGYMSPEQAAGVMDLTRATDVYSLGVVAYEMLVGGLPRTWVTPDMLAAGRFLDAAPDHRALLDRQPPGTERSLVRALALRSEERYPTAGEFASALANPETVGVPVVPLPVAVGAAAPPAGAVAVDTPVRRSAATPVRVPGFLGAPTRIVAERTVLGVLPTGEHEYLMDEIRAAVGHEGHGAASPGSLIWTSRKPKKPVGFDLEEWWESAQDDEGPDIAVRIVGRHGQTRIQVEQRLGGAAGGIFGGIMGGAGGAGTSVLLGVGLPLGASVALVLPGAALYVGATWALSRAIFRAVVASKTRMLEDLADRLAEQCAEVAL